jgi:hypothetical protein
MRVESLLVYPPVVSRWLLVLALGAIAILAFGLALLAFVGGDISGPLLTQVSENSIQPFRWA